MISSQLAELAIEHCSTSAFEQFCQIFASAEGQGEFVALGGVHDGGADGYLETTASTETFAQISKQASTEANTHDAELRQSASDSFSSRVMSVDAEVTADQIERVVACVHASLHHMYELQGLFLDTVREAGQFVHTDEARARYTIRKLTNHLKGEVYSTDPVEAVR